MIMMKYVLIFCISLFLPGIVLSQYKQLPLNVFSPDRSLHVTLTQTKSAGRADKLYYKVQKGNGKKGAVIIDSSVLGFATTNAGDFSAGCKVLSVSPIKEIKENYQLVSGKSIRVSYTANESSVMLENGKGVRFIIRFRVFNDGLAFRYELFKQKSIIDSVVVKKEFTAFKLAPESKIWVQPYDKPTKWTPAHEVYNLNGVPISGTISERGLYFPLLAQSGNHWILLSEAAANENYFASHIEYNALQKAYTIRQPEQSDGEGVSNNNAVMKLPAVTPWRCMTITENLQGIVSSQLINNLNPPSTIADISWIKPGIASWSWWSNDKSPKIYDSLKNYVDYSVSMHWPYSLVDANWEIMTGGNIEQLAAYAKTKNVGLWVWYNSGGTHNTVSEGPRNRLLNETTRQKEFAWLQSQGIKGIKVDFFQSDKQVIMKQYIGILKDAAKYKIMVNFHGCTLPRGWSRTYPNLLSMEAVCGEESYLFKEDFPANAPVQNTILPFTRNVVGHMDYTPVAFTKRKYPNLTTATHELALTIIFESGILHLADSKESYQAQPKYVQDFLQTIPVVWDEIQYISGMPGKEAVLARRKNKTWYIAGINGEPLPKQLLLTDFLINKKYTIKTFFEDEKDKIKSTVATSLPSSIQVKPYGGFILVAETLN
jgi:alpha-glucosidase